MERRYVVERAAEQDLASAIVYQRDHYGEDVASRFVEAALATFERIAAEDPGRVYETPTRTLQGMKRWFVRDFRNYLVFYRVFPERVTIERVLHGKRDVWGLLGIAD